MKKSCAVCCNEFFKKASHSKRVWLRKKYCSLKCKYLAGQSDETKMKISLSKVGLIPWNKGQAGNVSEETRKKMSSARLGKSPVNKGKRISEETREKIKVKRSQQVGFPTSANHWNWKGGKTKLVLAVRNLKESIDWRTSVFARDLFKCRMPLCIVEGKVQAHHIKTFSRLLNESKAKTLEEARNFQPMWDIRNGITLCPPCHAKVTWKEEQYEDLFNNIVRNSV